MKKKIAEALETLDAQMAQLRRQQARLLKEFYEEDTEAFIQEKGIYDLSSIKEFEDCALKFKCPLRWDDLALTEEEEVRYCSVCQENVYHTPTLTEFKQRIKEKRCVAVTVESEDEEEILAGVPMFIAKQ